MIDPFPTLDDRDCAVLTAGFCPTCLRRGFVLGPTALGLNFMIECASARCRDRFTVVIHHSHPGSVLSAQKVGNGRSGPAWPSEPGPAQPRVRIEEEWTCGHTAGSMCVECYRLLAARAHELAEENLKLRGSH